LERLEEARKTGTLILAEGESDVWTLWFHRFGALGLPGAEMTQTLKPEYLEGIERVYVIQEPDAAGAGFVKQIAAHLSTWQ
jgi:putative DNA primase/helicase